VGDVLLPGGRQPIDGPLLRVEEAWVNARPEVAEVLRPRLERIEQLRGRAMGIRLAPEGIDSLYDHFRTVQAEEVWASLGHWIETVKPRLGPGVRERFAAAKATDPAIAGPGRAFRRVLQARVRPLLASGAVLVFPTSPCPAPLLTARAAEQDAVRAATIGVTAIASLCGLPEVTLPAGTVDGAPVGLSLVAGAGLDRGLLAFACDAADVLGLPI
jgi:amidase